MQGLAAFLLALVIGFIVGVYLTAKSYESLAKKGGAPTFDGIVYRFHKEG